MEVYVQKIKKITGTSSETKELTDNILYKSIINMVQLYSDTLYSVSIKTKILGFGNLLVNIFYLLINFNLGYTRYPVSKYRFESLSSLILLLSSTSLFERNKIHELLCLIVDVLFMIKEFDMEKVFDLIYAKRTRYMFTDKREALNCAKELLLNNPSIKVKVGEWENRNLFPIIINGDKAHPLHGSDPTNEEILACLF
jgi:hypothetical protein